MDRSFIVIAAGLALAVSFPAAPAFALNAASFVSGHGSDGNPCTLAAPCRTLQRAHDQTNAGGEVDVLDTAGYGALVITKAISIVNDGVGTARVLVPASGIGITINAGASDAVNLRGLSIEAAGTGTNGIRFNSGQSLTIENCVIRHATGDGIDFFASGASGFAVSNTLVADNGGYGILVQPAAGGSVKATFTKVETLNNGASFYGIAVIGTPSSGAISATVTDSVSANNGGGYLARGDTSTPNKVVLMVNRSAAVNNHTGAQMDSVGRLLLGASTVTGNVNGIFNVTSYGDNYVDGNGTAETPLFSATRK